MIFEEDSPVRFDLSMIVTLMEKSVGHDITLNLQNKHMFSNIGMRCTNQNPNQSAAAK